MPQGDASGNPLARSSVGPGGECLMRGSFRTDGSVADASSEGAGRSAADGSGADEPGADVSRADRPGADEGIADGSGAGAG
ncbi:hypothetical protein [Nonomuraea roseoviolacea]|uniref:hypothetical protein n=1 Tax=Nonomuraea roseoviolacea TaxID=103837 RepID=UPI0031DD3DCC